MLGLGNALTTGFNKEQLYSLLLDGVNDWLDIGDNWDPGTSNFSVSLWFKADSDSGTNDVLFSKWEDNNNKIEIGINGSNKLFGQAIASSNNAFNDTANTELDALGLNWIHVVFTMDRDGNAKLYVNGSTSTYGETASSQHETQNLNNTGSIYIGARGDGSLDFPGKIDEVAIWATSLPETSVTAIYNSGKPFDLNHDRGNYTHSSNLHGYWRMGNGSFDDKQNGVVHDAHNPGFGSDLVVNGGFDADSNWTKQDGWTISGGTANFDFNNDNGSNRNLFPSSTILIAGNTYKLEFDITSVTAGGIRMVNSTVSDDTTFSTVGTHILYWRAVGPNLYMKADDDAVLSIDNVKVHKLNGYPGLTSKTMSVTGGTGAFSTDTPDD